MKTSNEADIKKGAHKPNLESNKIKTVPIWKLYSLVAENRGNNIQIIIMFVSSVIVGLAYPVNIFVYNEVVNILMIRSVKTERKFLNNSTTFSSNISKVSPEPSYADTLEIYIIHFTINALITFFFGFIQILFIQIISNRYGRGLKLKLFTALIYQDVGWYDSQETAKLITHMTDDISNIEMALTDKMALFVLEMSKFFGNIGLAFLADWKLSLVGLTAMPFVLCVFSCLLPIVQKYNQLEQDSYKISGSIAMECFHNIKTIIAYNAQRKCLNRFTDNLKLPEKYQVRKATNLSLAIGLIMFIVFSIAGLVFFVGLLFYKDNKIEPGSVMIVIFSIVIGVLSIGTALPLWDAVSTAQSTAAPIFDIIERNPPISYFNGGIKPSEFSGDIVFKNVSFHYPTRPSVQILNNLSITIPLGKTIAFVGPSGSGKSTIIQLLMRYYNPNNGEIYLGNQRIDEIDLKWYRSHLALVQQEPNLFSWKISENIKLGKLDATNDEIVKASKLSSAFEFINKTKDGFDSVIGEKGAGYSGGQKQRIAIAAALIRRKAKVILLDEATSALDNISERSVQESIDTLSRKMNLTVIVVAHKLATITKANTIVVMKQGEIYEIGNHDTLMEKEGLYYSMVLKQKGKLERRDIKMASTISRKSSPTLTHRSLSLKLSRKKAKRLEDQKDIKINALNDYDYNDENNGCFANTIDFMYLAKLTKDKHVYLVLGLMASGLLGLVFPVSSLIYAEIYNVFKQKITDPDLFEMNRILYPTLLIAPGSIFLFGQLTQDYALSTVKAFLTSKLRSMFLKSVLSQEVGWLDQSENHSGVLTARLAAEVSNSSDALTLQCSVLLEASTNLCAAICISFVCNWKLSFLFFVLVPMLMMSGIIRSGDNDDDQSNGGLVKSGSFVTEALENVKIINSYNVHEYFCEIFQEILKKRQSIRSTFFSSFFGAIGLASFYFAYALIFYVGGIMLDHGQIEVISLMRVFSCITLSAYSLARAVSLAPDIGKARKAARRTIKTLTREPLIDASGHSGAIPIKRLTGTIEFKNVYFCYPTRPSMPILLNLSFKHSAKKSLGLVGQSGCGKSTILQLLQRFYDPSSVEIEGQMLRGSILLDGYDMSTLNLMWVRNQIGVVSQEAHLFNMSVIDNITLSHLNKTPPDYYRVFKCAKKADIHQFVIKLPQKYETFIGEGGKSLSGGQRQRISIARALYKKPSILILDEATSALDTESEQAVNKSLKELTNKYTSVQIAHRLKIIKESNLILVLDAGEVVEQGTHDELLRMRGYYYQLQKNAMEPSK